MNCVDTRCPGSFKTVPVSGTNYTRVANKLHLECPNCKRLVGLRVRSHSGKAVLQMHSPNPPKAAKCFRCHRPYSEHSGETHSGKQHRCPNTALNADHTFMELATSNRTRGWTVDIETRDENGQPTITAQHRALNLTIQRNVADIDKSNALAEHLNEKPRRVLVIAGGLLSNFDAILKMTTGKSIDDMVDVINHPNREEAERQMFRDVCTFVAPKDIL